MATTPFLTQLLVFLLGLCLGSLLNVVIDRLPVMLGHRWRTEAQASLELELEVELDDHPSLLTPQPCHHCQAPQRWRDRLPLLGWLMRRGRCTWCYTHINGHHPLVEIASGLLSLAVVVLFGVSWEAGFILAACLALLALAVIDLRTYLLPDAITLPLLWSGLLYQLLFHPMMLSSAVAGAMMGYLSLWGIFWAIKLTTGREGMGYGDFKLLAALGAWLGWAFMPIILVLSAGFGVIIALAVQINPARRGQPLPFGHLLALAGGASLLFGDDLMAVYLGMFS